MSKKIIAPVLTFAVSTACVFFVSGFSLDDVLTIICLATFIGGAVIYASFNSKDKPSWIGSILSAASAGVAIGLIREWTTNLQVIFNGNYIASLIVACFGGAAFFMMAIKQIEEVISIFENGSKLEIIPIILTASFWFTLVIGFHQVPWYGHLILGLAAVISSILVNKGKAKCTILDETLNYSLMFAHFAAEGSIAAHGVARLNTLVFATSVLTELGLDLPAMMPNNHNHTTDKTNSGFPQLVKTLLASFYAFCLAVLGYFEVPKALQKLFRLNTIELNICTWILITLGAISCFLVNANILNDGAHDHSGFTPFAWLFGVKKEDGKDTCQASNHSWYGKLARRLLACCGAVLTSTVGVVIASEIFDVPIWLWGIIGSFAFVVEFNFHYKSYPENVLPEGGFKFLLSIKDECRSYPGHSASQ